ncbi:MAG TPA: hypothetical protein VKB03_02100, partial [Conexibacter sp.]|nr:hypothetical protein [Conexibacter sp.]
ELERIVTAARRGDPEPDVRALGGWRRELVGAELAQLLEGRRVVTIERGRLAVRDAAVPADAE